jgi:hypothetical protein
MKHISMIRKLDQKCNPNKAPSKLPASIFNTERVNPLYELYSALNKVKFLIIYLPSSFNFVHRAGLEPARGDRRDALLRSSAISLRLLYYSLAIRFTSLPPVYFTYFPVLLSLTSIFLFLIFAL